MENIKSHLRKLFSWAQSRLTISAATVQSDKIGQEKGGGEKEIKATGFLNGKHNLSLNGATNDSGLWVLICTLL